MSETEVVAIPGRPRMIADSLEGERRYEYRHDARIFHDNGRVTAITRDVYPGEHE